MKRVLRKPSILGRLRTDSRAFKGLVCVSVVAVLLAGLASKSFIVTTFTGGTTIKAEFSTDYNLRDKKTKVKMAGLQVGKVTGIEPTDHGTTIVSMKVDDDALEKLGPKPEAQVDPLTILGGQVSVNLIAGGGQGEYDGSMIPLSRTTVPTELDQILEALPADTRTALQGTTHHLADALAQGGASAILRLAADSQQPFADAGAVFQATNGRRGEHDLANLVADLHTIGATLEGRTKSIDQSLDGLNDVVGVLARQRDAVGLTVERLPGALQESSRGLAALQETLDNLDVAAESLKPTAVAARPLVLKLDEVLPRVRPLMAELRPTLRDARPLVADLVPVTQRTTTILRDVRGPVLERVNDRILPMLDRPWRGTGPYAKSGRGVQKDNKFYEEIGYMVTNLDRASMVQDAQGSLLNFAVGIGTGTVQPYTLDEVLEALAVQVLGGAQ